MAKPLSPCLVYSNSLLAGPPAPALVPYSLFTKQKLKRSLQHWTGAISLLTTLQWLLSCFRKNGTWWHMTTIPVLRRLQQRIKSSRPE
jgi:hypothetical protein